MEVKLALAQYPITAFDSIEAWKVHISKWVKLAVEQKAALLVFPEYGSMELTALLKHTEQGDLDQHLEEIQALLPEFKEHFRKLAYEHDCTIVAPSFPVKMDSEFVNRAYVFSPSKEGFQDKWFMTRFENETWGISSPTKKITVFEMPWGKFGVQICYDIEFPIGSQLLAENGAQLIVAPSCTETIQGATRVHVGARARAMEQQIFVAVAQTVGEAMWSPAVDINFGYSAVYSSPDTNLPPLGIISEGTHQAEKWLYEKIDFEKSTFIQNEGQVFNSKDMHRLFILMSEEVEIGNLKLY